MQSSAGAPAKWGALAALILLPVLVHVALATGMGVAAASGVSKLVGFGLVAASALPHTLLYTILLATFGLTLLPGRDPLVTMLARQIHGALSGEMVAYTRGVTVAWCCFFVAQLATSLLLFLLAPLTAWSFFVNVMDVPLVVLMFVAESVYRRIYLADPPHYSLSQIIGMVDRIKAGHARQEQTELLPGPWLDRPCGKRVR